MSAEKSAPRLHHLDHLRAALVILVVLHHVALVYGAAAPFYYQEPPFDDPVAFMGLAVFVLLNQSWFMGALFLLAGYFTPASFDSKGPAQFLKGRLVRLGIPILVGIFVLEPIARLGFFLMPASMTGITDEPDWSTYPHLLGLGPLWFIAMLLAFDFGYAAWRAVTKPPSTAAHDSMRPGLVTVCAFVLGLAAASYLLRIVVPLGEEVRLIAPFLNFPTIAYLPQYLSFFVLGIAAYRLNWLNDLPQAVGLAGFAVALAAAVLLLPLALSGEFLNLIFAENGGFTGRGHWQSAIYALWDSTMAVGLSLGAIVLFRRFFDQSGRLGAFLSQHSYAVYVIHAPILVFGAYAMRTVELPALAKFCLAAIVLTPLCFAAAFVIRKLPLAKRVF